MRRETPERNSFAPLTVIYGAPIKSPAARPSSGPHLEIGRGLLGCSHASEGLSRCRRLVRCCQWRTQKKIRGGGVKHRNPHPLRTPLAVVLDNGKGVLGEPRDRFRSRPEWDFFVQRYFTKAKVAADDLLGSPICESNSRS